MTFILIYYVVGYLLSFVWAIRYRRYMTRRDWVERFLMGFIHGLFGPFSILTSFPV